MTKRGRIAIAVVAVRNWADEREFEIVQYDEGEIEAEEIKELILEVPRDNSVDGVFDCHDANLPLDELKGSKDQVYIFLVLIVRHYVVKLFLVVSRHVVDEG